MTSLAVKVCMAYGTFHNGSSSDTPELTQHGPPLLKSLLLLHLAELPLGHTVGHTRGHYKTILVHLTGALRLLTVFVADICIGSTSISSITCLRDPCLITVRQGLLKRLLCFRDTTPSWCMLKMAYALKSVFVIRQSGQRRAALGDRHYLTSKQIHQSHQAVAKTAVTMPASSKGSEYLCRCLVSVLQRLRCCCGQGSVGCRSLQPLAFHEANPEAQATRYAALAVTLSPSGFQSFLVQGRSPLIHIQAEECALTKCATQSCHYRLSPQDNMHPRRVLRQSVLYSNIYRLAGAKLE